MLHLTECGISLKSKQRYELLLYMCLLGKESPAEAILAALAMFGNPLTHNDINKGRHSSKQLGRVVTSHPFFFRIPI